MEASQTEHRYCSEEIKIDSPITLRRSYVDLIPLIILFLLSVILVAFISLSEPETTPRMPVQVFIPMALLAVIFHRKFNRYYIITREGVKMFRGLLGLNLSEQMVDVNRMKHVELKQNILQRILGVGDISISTVLIEEPEVRIRGIYQPYDLISLIKDAIDREYEQQSHNHLISSASANIGE